MLLDRVLISTSGMTFINNNKKKNISIKKMEITVVDKFVCTIDSYTVRIRIIMSNNTRESNAQ